MCFPNIPMSHCISAPPVHTTQDLPIRQRSRRVGSYEPPVDSTRRHAMYISALVWGEGQWRPSTYTDSDTEQEQKRRWREGWNFIKNALKIGPRAPSPRV